MWGLYSSNVISVMLAQRGNSDYITVPYRAGSEVRPALGLSVRAQAGGNLIHSRRPRLISGVAGRPDRL